ncbi:fructosamine kinase family protein [Dinghuibacter silviterrae]|uniref:Fructosamine-3-kinase n=1 Tax=Dinghuibacter silviterrae TaxID=1539049 RepID=A0A4R8DF54_9BACT|nr:fructosamine kinase family protein [Dinghuibacter silviterrae]TDW96209.1 fructosamine-3-kinase [Dinghuibacter silviterrae]
MNPSFFDRVLQMLREGAPDVGAASAPGAGDASATGVGAAGATRRVGGGTVTHISRVSGGDISDAYVLETGGGRFFCKVQDATRGQAMFEAEVRGLEALRPHFPRVPAVVGTGTLEGKAFLVLEWLQEGKPRPDRWERLGEALARLHRGAGVAAASGAAAGGAAASGAAASGAAAGGAAASGAAASGAAASGAAAGPAAPSAALTFGLEADNFIATLPQDNHPEPTWPAFYTKRRLLPLWKQGIARGLFSVKTLGQVEALEARMNQFFPKNLPSLLHGDLWSGNTKTGPDGDIWIFDPAVYRGHREMDLAMTRLFGGFPPEFYEAYGPLDAGWEERVAICQLYPLLVHALLFGGGYVQECMGIVATYAGG